MCHQGRHEVPGYTSLLGPWIPFAPRLEHWEATWVPLVSSPCFLTPVAPGTLALLLAYCASGLAFPAHHHCWSSVPAFVCPACVLPPQIVTVAILFPFPL